MAKSSSADRLRMRLNRGEGLGNLSQIILDHAYIDGAPFSFKDHEYQIDILNDTHQRMAVQKCSQVGLSELMVQKLLAVLTSWPNIRIIFSLPTKDMAMVFSKDRIDGAIIASDHYSEMTSAGENSAGYKKIASSSLYVIGTFGAKSAISVPAEFLIEDEVDFSDPVILGKLESRIRHAKTVDEFDNRGYRYRFSTPTVEGFGVNKDFTLGDQRYYMCKCDHCETWVLPDYRQDFVVPGFTDDIMKFGKMDLESTRNRVQDAWIKCPGCGHNLFRALLDPARRQWVAKRTEVQAFRSYQVSPWDVPVYNTPPAIIRQVEGYPLRSDYMNFVIGLPYSDKENSFETSPQHMDRFCTLDLWVAGMVMAGPMFGGMDVGTRIHFNVRVRVGTRSHIVLMEVIHSNKATPGQAYDRILGIYDSLGLHRLCIDNGPDITLVNMLVNARENIQSVVYVSNVPGTLPVVEKHNGLVVNADRTKTLKLVMEQHNEGEVSYPGREDLKTTLTKHLATTKRIRENDGLGGYTEKFIKTNTEDHWVHSLNYSNIAMLVSEYSEGGETVVGVMPGVATARLGQNSQAQQQQDHLKGLFGVGKSSRRRLW